MPLVRIDLVRGRNSVELKFLADQIHSAIVEVMKVPLRDRFQIITQHDPTEIFAEDAGLGFERDEKIVMIQITTQAGRDTNLKQRLFQKITSALAVAGVEPRNVFISYVENTAADWTFGYGRAQFVTGELRSYSP